MIDSVIDVSFARRKLLSNVDEFKKLKHMSVEINFANQDAVEQFVLYRAF